MDGVARVRMNSASDPKRFRRHHANAERTTAPLCGDIITVYRTLVISAASRHYSNGSKDFLIPDAMKLMTSLAESSDFSQPCCSLVSVHSQSDRLAPVEDLLNES